jgi:hypothetical protein
VESFLKIHRNDLQAIFIHHRLLFHIGLACESIAATVMHLNATWWADNVHIEKYIEQGRGGRANMPTK